MRASLALLGLGSLASISQAACPFMDTDQPNLNKRAADIHGRQEPIYRSGPDFLTQFTVEDTDDFLTSDVGGPIQDNISLKAGDRGPTLLEDFIFRQKITHFDHERVCYRTLQS